MRSHARDYSVWDYNLSCLKTVSMSSFDKNKATCCNLPSLEVCKTQKKMCSLVHSLGGKDRQSTCLPQRSDPDGQCMHKSRFFSIWYLRLKRSTLKSFFKKASTFVFNCVSTHTHVCKIRCVGGCKCMSVCGWGAVRGQSLELFLRSCPPCVLRLGLSLGPEAHLFY